MAIGSGAPGALTAGQLPASPADLHYRAALFDYYQRDYFSALSGLLMGEQELGPAGPRVLFLQAAARLGAGMTAQARRDLERLTQPWQRDSVRNAICLHRCPAATDLPPADALNAAWFYLGKLHYQREDWASASAAFARSGEPLATPLRQERSALLTNLAIRSGELEQADARLASETPDNPWLPYGRYNLGAAYLDRQNPERGFYWLDQLIAMPADGTELAALRDKALVTTARWLLAQDEHARAEDYFRRVRTNSPWVDQALLGYGLARSETARYPEALIAWRALAARPTSSLPVQDALLAVPYSYEQMGQAGQALSRYILADRELGAELQRVAALTERIKQGEPFAALFASAGHPPWWQSLVDLISSPRFQVNLQQLDELAQLQARLARWQEKLATYRQLLNDIGALHETSLDAAASIRYRNRLDALQAAHPLQSQPDISAATAPRLQTMAPLDAALDRPENFVARLLQLGEPAAGTPPASYQARIDQLESRLRRQRARLAQAAQTTDTAARALVLAELERQQARLRRYQTHARVAAARLSIETAR